MLGTCSYGRFSLVPSFNIQSVQGAQVVADSECVSVHSSKEGVSAPMTADPLVPLRLFPAAWVHFDRLPKWHRAEQAATVNLTNFTTRSMP